MGAQDAWGALLLLLLSCFSRVRLYATPEMAAHQALLSLGFSRQEHWSGLPLPSPNSSDFPFLNSLCHLFHLQQQVGVGV